MIPITTVISTIILFIITAVFLYGTFKTNKPSMVKSDGKVNEAKTLGFSIFFALLFSSFVFVLSILVNYPSDAVILYFKQLR